MAGSGSGNRARCASSARTVKAGDTDDDGDLCEVQRVEIADEEGKHVADEGMKYGGPQRLRLTLAAAPEARQLQFRYYFELFGKLTLPD